MVFSGYGSINDSFITGKRRIKVKKKNNYKELKDFIKDVLTLHNLDKAILVGKDGSYQFIRLNSLVRDFECITQRLDDFTGLTPFRNSELCDGKTIKDFMVFVPKNITIIKDFLIPLDEDACILDLRDGYIEVV